MTRLSITQKTRHGAHTGSFPAGRARRGRILFLVADRMVISDVAATVENGRGLQIQYAAAQHYERCRL